MSKTNRTVTTIRRRRIHGRKATKSRTRKACQHCAGEASKGENDAVQRAQNPLPARSMHMS